MAVVVDASSLAAVLFGEPGHQSVARQLRGHVLHAPTLIDYELANVALKKLRRVPADADALLAAMHTVRRLRLERVQPDMMQVLALAATTGLTTYDASYLWVARSLGVKLVSLDHELNEAAERL